MAFNRFKQMIEQGIARGPWRESENVLPNDTPETDYICRTYNNFWGIVTDTHMSVMEDGNRVITGSFVAKTKVGYPTVRVLDEFLMTTRWGAVEFPCSFTSILSNNNLQTSYTTMNGQEVCLLLPGNTEDTFNVLGEVQ